MCSKIIRSIHAIALFALLALATPVVGQLKLPLAPESDRHTDHELIRTQNAGNNYYQSKAPTGGILVGFLVHDAKDGESTSHSVRLDPIYQLEGKDQPGEPSKSLRPTQSRLVRAKPGFAVCGVHFSDGVLDRIKFAKLNPKTFGFRSPYDERLFSAEDQPVESEQEWMCGGPIFGIAYQYSQLGMSAISFRTDAKTKTRGDATANSKPQLNGRGYPLGASSIKRTWTSDRGRQLVARLVSFDGKEVRLQTEEGKPFALPLSKYSSEDQAFLAQLRKSR